MRIRDSWVGLAAGVVLAVAGGFAVNGALDNADAQAGFSVTPGQLQINQRISQAAVRRANTNRRAIEQLRSGGAGTGAQGPAGPRGPAGPAGAPGAAATSLWAAVENAGSDCRLLRASGALSAEVVGVSRCDITFDRDVSACIPSATSAETAPAHVTAVTYDDLPNPDPSGVTREEVYVATANADGTSSRHDFYLVVFC